MRRAIRILLTAAALTTVLAPARARAEGYVAPWAGMIFGNDDAEKGFKSFGLAAGDMGGGMFGGEFNAGFTPGFFGDSVNNYVFDVMSNLTVGPHFDGPGYSVLPYGILGVGLIRTSVDAGLGGATAASNNFGFNAGIGVTTFVSVRIGIRGDVRYFRVLSANDVFNSLVDLDTFHFWRASFGVVIR